MATTRCCSPTRCPGQRASPSASWFTRQFFPVAPMTDRSRNAATARRGFTLVELMMTVVLISIIGLMLTMVLVRQSRFHRALQDVSEARNRMRDIATIVPTDLRGVSSSQNDILAYGRDSLQFRAFVGTSVLCEFVTGSPTIIGVPPKALASGDVLSAWINAPAVGDIAYVYDDGTKAGNADDSWQRYSITAVASAADATWCASTLSPAYTAAADNAQTRYRFTLDAAPPQATTKRGAVIRFAREVRYSGYLAADGQWYMGYQTCTPSGVSTTTPGTCGTTEVLAGPIMPITTDTTTT